MIVAVAFPALMLMAEASEPSTMEGFFFRLSMITRGAHGPDCLKTSVQVGSYRCASSDEVARLL